MNNVEEYILLTVWFCFDFILFSHRFSFSFDLSCICFENLHHQLRWSVFQNSSSFFFRTVDSWIKFYYLKEMKGKTIVFLLLSIMPGDVEADTADEICKERLISSLVYVCVRFWGEGEMKPRGFCNVPLLCSIWHIVTPPPRLGLHCVLVISVCTCHGVIYKN